MQKPKKALLSILLASQLLNVSCGDRSGGEAPAKLPGGPKVGTVHIIEIRGAEDVYDEYSSGGDTKLSMSNDDRITWKNVTNTDYVVCFQVADQTQQPFHAFGWLVPASKNRDSGKIRDDATQTTVQYDVSAYQSGQSLCKGDRGNPKIIIQQ